MLHINIPPSRSHPPPEIGLQKHNQRVIRSVRFAWSRVFCPKSNLFESQLPFTSFRPTETLAWKPEIKDGTFSRALRPPSIEHVDSNNGRRTSRGDHDVVRGVRGSLDEGLDEGSIEFEVGGEAVEVEDAGIEVEWGIEAEGKLWMIGRAGTSAISSAMFVRTGAPLHSPFPASGRHSA